MNARHRVSNKKQSNTHPKKKVSEACYRMSLHPYIPVRIGIGVGRGRVTHHTYLPTNRKNCLQQWLSRRYSAVSGFEGGGAVRKSLTIFGIACP